MSKNNGNGQVMMTDANGKQQPLSNIQIVEIVKKQQGQLQQQQGQLQQQQQNIQQQEQKLQKLQNDYDKLLTENILLKSKISN